MKTNKKFFAAYVIFMAAFHSNLVFAQKSIDLKDLNIPNSPAFTLLDYSPAVIDRPGTIRAVNASFVSVLGQSDGLPKNFAIEIAPFWLFKNKLNVYDYLGIDNISKKQKNIFSNIRSASFSLGSIFRDSSETQAYNANYFSGGIRANVIRVMRKQLIPNLVTNIQAIALRQTQLLAPIATNCLTSNTAGTEAYNDCIASQATTAFGEDATLKAQELTLQRLLAVKPLFQLDLAGATSTVFQNNTVSANHHFRTGFWGTFQIAIPLTKAGNITQLVENKNYFNIYGMGRYITEDSTIDFITFQKNNLLDLGGRIEFEFEKLAISFETVHRMVQNSDAENTNRNVGVIQYRVSEKLFLSGTFGKNFGSVNNLIALFGLNWGFGKESLIPQ